jgi:cyclopropane fatty-acyl-phospholipid synthase-like methyltransferase
MEKKDKENLDKYWTDRGTVYYNEYYDQPKYELERLKTQEKFLLDNFIDKKINSILEVGCGFGRYTKILSSIINPESYTAIDISNSQIEKAKKYVKNDKIDFITSRFQDYDSSKKYDLVFASEILMHIDFSKINDFIEKLVSLSKNKILTIDWYEHEEMGNQKGGYCFMHDYEKIFKKFGVKNVNIQMIPLTTKLKAVNAFTKLRRRHGVGRQAIISIEV